MNIKEQKEKQTYTKREVIEMLQSMQEKSLATNGLIAGHLSTLWVVRDLIGQQIKELGGEEIQYTIKKGEYYGK